MAEIAADPRTTAEIMSLIYGQGVPVGRILEAKRHLLWCAKRDDECGPAVKLALYFISRWKRCPKNAEELKAFFDFAQTAEESSQELKAEFSSSSGYFLDALEKVETHQEDKYFTAPPAEAWEATLDAWIDNTRKLWMAAQLRQAGQIVIGQVPDSRKKGAVLSGIGDAQNYLRRVYAHDPGPREQPLLQGSWIEHIDDVQRSLHEAITNDPVRIATGMEFIDNAVSIGPGEQNRFIGLLGYTNHGKSTFAKCLAYKFAVEGKRVLYCPQEEQSKSVMAQLCGMHGYWFNTSFPSIQHWFKHPHTVTQEHVNNFEAVLDDLRGAIAGDVDVRDLHTWEEIVDHLEMQAVPYDVLIIDYIAHLDTGTNDTSKHRDKIIQIFKKAQNLCLKYHKGRGLVIISPLQANRKGMREAQEAEGEDEGVYGTDAIDWYSIAAQSMDLIIGLWFGSQFKAADQIKVSCVKSRTEYFPNHICEIDPRTRYIRDQVNKQKSKQTAWAKPVKRTHWMKEFVEASTDKDLEAID